MGEFTAKANATRAQYEAAEERIRTARAEASRGFEEARDAGDLKAAARWHESLQGEIAAFRAVRESFPEPEFLALTSERILRTLFFEEVAARDHTHTRTHRVVNLTIPGGVSDTQAVESLRYVFEETFSPFLDALNPLTLDFLVSQGGFAGREMSAERRIRLVPVVAGTVERNLVEQENELRSQGMTLATPAEQALAALAFHVSTDRGDLFEGNFVRGSVPKNAIRVGPLSHDRGVHVVDNDVFERSPIIGASGVFCASKRGGRHDG